MRPELVQAAELLRRATPEAVEQAIGLLQNTVYSFSMKVCGHPEDAEDNMQEVLYRSLRHLVKIHDPQALAVWLYTVTRNRCWRTRRKAANAPAHNYSLDELLPDDAELGRLLQDAADDPEATLLHSERDDLLHQAVLRIPAQLRIVLVLHDMEELSSEQVAQVLDLKPGTVRVRLHRARLSVRREIDQLTARTCEKKDSGSKARAGSAKTSKRNRPAECRELFANLSEYLDDRAEPATCEQMRTHIESCPACVAFVRELRSAIDRCRSIEMPCDASVSSRLRVLLSQEYLRMLGMSRPEKMPALL